MPVASEFTSILKTTHTINFTECYPNGFLRYTDLCNILQLSAGQHAEMGGISFSDMQEFNQAWVLSRMRLEIEALPKWKDEIIVKTWIVSLEKSRSVRALEMYKGDVKLVGCETFWAVFNTQSRRPEPLALAHGHFEKFGDHFSTQKRVKKIELNQPMDSQGNRNVMLSDLDIVNHANNVKYLEWCLDLEDHEIILSGEIKTLDMNFMSEVLLNDTVELRKNNSDKGATHSVEKSGKLCFALDIKF